MYAVCLRYARTPADAADILQEGFIKVYTKLNQYHFQGSFEGWIRRIMVNTALRTYQRHRYELEQTGLERLPESPQEADAIALLSEGELLGMIGRLPDGYRLVLGIQESTSRSQLTKARRWLSEELNKATNVGLIDK